MKNTALFPLILALVTGCATTADNNDTQAESGAETAVVRHDYPTRERVEYVLECIAKHGGLNFVNQYACGCKIDKIAEQLTFEEFEAARTFSQMQKTPGEAGAAFRDPKHAKDLKASLKEVEAAAEKACFVK
ncbi:MAG: hypothetical protein CTY22_06060 [Methylomonas sp.]|nr:MAG: hypothetical protein CTY23_02405 [Methylomonas sp.]PPD26195.1 MAG: hypothetical protein CTY22_06060 [Methylomonas sp.]PPD37912.1 MAG: hypothetical protein CTY21_06055 [Methylomonas sp.]PPD42084.1 MAG: hypothetical protein CTY17_02130 [Methylomonas sp.]PPD53626.1 MAG: hypothetical protein CTY11_06070 [Methylomonas sp.]